MDTRTLWHFIGGIKWKSTVATVLANIRLYGCTATLRKIRLRVKVLFDEGVYRKSNWGRGREIFEKVSKATELFGRPSILIVGALDLPQCKKYRVSQKVEFFSSIGWDCYFSHYADPARVISYLQISTSVIFYRVPTCAQFNDYIKEAGRLGIKTFYDIDDPIFDVAVYGENKNLEHIKADERAELLASASDYRRAMEQVDALILSTTYLKNLATADFGGPAYLWRNLVDSATLAIVESVNPGTIDRDPNRVVLGYASGSRAHDEDFRVVSNGLANILDKYKHVELDVIGYAIIPPELRRFKDRINVRPFSGYFKYFEALSQIDIHVVPLVDDRFNSCKSAIRYLEASLCSVPTVASSVGQFSEIIVDGQDGFLAATQASWESALGKLIDSRELRLTMGEAAKEKVMAQHTFSCPAVIDQELLDQFALSNG